MRVLLLSAVPQDKVFFEAAAKYANMAFEVIPSADAAAAGIQKDATSIVVVDSSTPEQFKAFEKVIADKIGLFSALFNPNNLYFVASSSFHDAPYLAQSEIFGHFVQRSYTQDNILAMTRLFQSSVSDRALKLEAFMGKEVKTQTIKITKSVQKRPIVESLKNYVLKIGFKSRVAAQIATATDELIMNAIFDAPVDEIGKHVYAQTPRNTALDLDERNVVELKIAFDMKTLGISVTDLHGSVDKKKLLSQHLGRSYENKEYEMKTVVAGAGLGLAHVYRNSGGMIISCEAGIKTEVNLLFKKTDSFRDFKDQFRFLSTFMYFS